MPTFTSPSVILDLGANIGLTALRYKHAFKDARVICVEMDSGNFKLLERNLTNFEDVVLYNNAISDRQGSHYYRQDSYDSFSLTEIDIAIESAYLTAEGIRIIDIINDQGLNRVDFIKIDVEGFEVKLFQNSDSWLSKVVELSCEVHSTKDKLEIVDILHSNNFLVLNTFDDFKRVHAISRHWILSSMNV
jgi:FkbM family methyltransferase